MFIGQKSDDSKVASSVRASLRQIFDDLVVLEQEPSAGCRTGLDTATLMRLLECRNAAVTRRDRWRFTDRNGQFLCWRWI